MLLKDLCDHNIGTYGIGASACAYNEEYPVYLRITDISDDGKLLKPFRASINPKDYPNWKDYILKMNDLVFARTGNSTGRNYFHNTNEQLVYAGFLIRFSINPSKVLPRYVGYYCQSESYWNQIKTFLEGSTRPTMNAELYKSLNIPIAARELQQHIVDTIGSLDSLIEFNQEKISKIKSLATQKYEFLYKAYPKSVIGKRIKFVKGKQPKFAPKEDGLPYLVIDDLASNIYTQFSSEGLACDENDVLMVMDGASSGKVFTGNKGYVGSTLAKLSSSQIKSSILYFGLSKFEEEIMKNTTGSAIPHTDKSFVSELRIIDDLDGKTTNFFDFCLNQICNLRAQNSLLNIQKEILLRKYFH